MYKTIIVEDEYDVRKAIISSIDWEGCGFVVAGEAGNGQEALELIGQVEPDLVITDIKMPFMDGIQLASAIREINPVTKIVFLSGFNEFDYAISAMKLNVIEYILKPVSRKELSAALDNIRGKLDEERSRSRDVERLRQRFDRDRTILKTSFLISLIKSSPTQEESLHKIEKYGLQLTGESFRLFTISIDKTSLDESCINTDDTELMLISASDIACEVGEKYLRMEDFIYDENIVVLLSDTAENMEAYSDILICEVRQHIHKYCGFSVTIGVSRIFGNLLEAHTAYNDSISAIHYRLVGGGDRIIYIGDFERDTASEPTGLTEVQAAAFNSLIKTGTPEEVSNFIGRLFDDLCTHNASLTSYQACIVELFTLLMKAVQGSPQDLGLNIGSSLNYMAELYKQETVDKIKVWFEELCHNVMGSIDRQRKDAAQILADQACDYIALHYANCELSLKLLSDHLHVSPNYLSSIIKREQGESFTTLLTKIRMKNAHELLLTTNRTIQDIAEATGYADRHYFSYCFKKHYNISPAQMRSKQRAEREEYETGIS